MLPTLDLAQTVLPDATYLMRSQGTARKINQSATTLEI